MATTGILNVMLKNPKSAVEQFHLLFLDQLGRKLDKDLYALKGGCNLRFYFHSIRYSEDIDLDVNTIAVSTLQNKVNRILESKSFEMILASRNISLHSISFHKQTQTTQRWKIQLNVSGTSFPINTKIEFSRREGLGDVGFDVVNSEIIGLHQIQPLYLNHYDGSTAMAQKIHALAMRSQTQARDVFDLHLLIRQGIKITHPSSDTLVWKSGAIENASTITYADFKSQVVSYLEDDYQRQYADEKIWDDIQLTILNALEGLEK